MQKFHGIMTTSNPSKVPKIWEVNHVTGKYTGRNETEYGSKISLWVPVPRHGEHLPGIFLRLSNPSGTAYTRLTAEEFAELYTFIRHNYAPANEALSKAAHLTKIYSAAERALAIESGLITPEQIAAELEDTSLIDT